MLKDESEEKKFTMPQSLSYIKILASSGIDYKGLHVIDVASLAISICIDNARQRLEMRKHEELSKRGYSGARKATEAEFDAL